MAMTWSQRMLLQSGRYLQEAFSEPGVLHVFEEDIFNLRDPGCVSAFRTLTDASIGGKSTAEIRHSKDEGEDEGCIVFEGQFSSEIPPDAPKNVRRLGQASFAFKEQEGHYLYLGDYERQVASTIRCRVKGDGRIYGMYLKTDSYFEGVGMNELWQAHLRTRPDEWHDFEIRVVEFILTRNGYLTEENRIPNLRRVTSIGFSVIGGAQLQEEGPYKLCISNVIAGYDTDRSSGNED